MNFENNSSESSKEYQIDEVDKKILNLLQDNFKITFKQLSDKVGLAPSSIHNRVSNMIKAGIIQKTGTLVNPIKVGFKTVAILGLTVDPLRMTEIAKKLASFHQIQMVGTTTGDHDILVRIIAENDKDLWRFINLHIKTIEGIKPQMDVSSFIDFYKKMEKVYFPVEE